MNIYQKSRSLFSTFVAFACVFAMSGCGDSDPEARIKAEEAKLTKGMTPQQVQDKLGKPAQIIGPVKGKDGKLASMFIYTDKDPDLNLWVHFAEDKMTWTSADNKKASIGIQGASKGG